MHTHIQKHVPVHSIIYIHVHIHYNCCLFSESLQLPTVHQILQLTANSYEHMVMDKRDKPLAIEWGQR